MTEKTTLTALNELEEQIKRCKMNLAEIDYQLQSLYENKSKIDEEKRNAKCQELLTQSNRIEKTLNSLLMKKSQFKSNVMCLLFTEP
jgi:septal ring factor EnvC (AmiA/AmiB activator)